MFALQTTESRAETHTQRTPSFRNTTAAHLPATKKSSERDTKVGRRREDLKEKETLVPMKARLPKQAVNKCDSFCVFFFFRWIDWKLLQIAVSVGSCRAASSSWLFFLEACLWGGRPFLTRRLLSNHVDDPLATADTDVPGLGGGSGSHVDMRERSEGTTAPCVSKSWW